MGGTSAPSLRTERPVSERPASATRINLCAERPVSEWRLRQRRLVGPAWAGQSPLGLSVWGQMVDRGPGLEADRTSGPRHRDQRLTTL